jgi:hypothetical protein
MPPAYQPPAAVSHPALRGWPCLLLLLVALSVSPSAQAAPPAAKNGGSVTVVDGHPVEFVSTDQSVTFYISDDDGSPLSTKGITGRAMLLTNGKTVVVPLTPEAPNRLTGPLAAPLSAGDKVLLDAKLHGHKLQPRFVK